MLERCFRAAKSSCRQHKSTSCLHEQTASDGRDSSSAVYRTMVDKLGTEQQVDFKSGLMTSRAQRRSIGGASVTYSSRVSGQAPAVSGTPMSRGEDHEKVEMVVGPYMY
jgi:hypothetical protein